MASVQTETAKTGNGAAAAASDMEAQLKQLRADLSALASTVAAAGSEKADGYKARVGEMASNVKDASVTAVQNLREELMALERKVEGGVRERPMQAVGIALATGFALALLARR